MRPLIRNLVAGGVGGLVGSSIVLISLIHNPVSILPAGSHVTIAAFETNPNLDAAASRNCVEHPCGSAGVAQLSFSVSSLARLSGALHASQPVLLAIASHFGDNSVGCGLISPPPPCPAIWSTDSYAFFLNSPSTVIDLASLELNFTGANNELPSDSWNIFLVNWNPGSVDVTADTNVLATP